MANLSCKTLQDILGMDKETLQVALRTALSKCDELAEKLEKYNVAEAEVEYGYAPLIISTTPITLGSAHRTAEEQRRLEEYRAKLEQARRMSAYDHAALGIDITAGIKKEPPQDGPGSELRKKDIDWKW